METRSIVRYEQCKITAVVQLFKITAQGVSHMFSKSGVSLLIFSMFILALAGCGAGDTATTASSNVPDGALWADQHIFRSIPPNGYSAAIGWAQAVTKSVTHDANTPATVEVDWWELVEKLSDGSQVVVFREDYNDSLPRQLRHNEEGGLFMRSPRWFFTNFNTEPVNTQIQNGQLTVFCNLKSNSVTHWWTHRVNIYPGATYFQRMRVKISGDAWLQLGGDWWRSLAAIFLDWNADCSLTNTCDGYVGKWYGNTGGQYVEISVPIY